MESYQVGIFWANHRGGTPVYRLYRYVQLDSEIGCLIVPAQGGNAQLNKK